MREESGGDSLVCPRGSAVKGGGGGGARERSVTLEFIHIADIYFLVVKPGLYNGNNIQHQFNHVYYVITTNRQL